MWYAQGSSASHIGSSIITLWACADLVSFSSRLIAAVRALEAEEEAPMFVDPHAKLLAGMTCAAVGRYERMNVRG